MVYREFHKQTMPEEIVQEILQKIQKGELRPGDTLPTESELMKNMGVSRSCVREALRALSIMNIIVIHPGRRTYITSLAPDLLMEHLEFVISLEDATLLQLFEVRKLIEVACAGLAAERIQDDEIQSLEALLQQDQTENIDAQLHRQIVEITKNPILKRVYTSIEKLGEISRRLTEGIPGVYEQSLKDHAIVVQTIISRDPKTSQEAMLKHLTFMEAKLRQNIASNEHPETVSNTVQSKEPINVTEESL